MARKPDRITCPECQRVRGEDIIRIRSDGHVTVASVNGFTLGCSVDESYD